MHSLRADGKRIRRARMLAGLKSAALAELIGVHPQSVRRWECGQTAVQADRLRLIAEVCNTTVSYLLGEEGYDEPFRRFTGEIPFRHTPSGD